jgi:hypothetical protein
LQPKDVRAVFQAYMDAGKNIKADGSGLQSYRDISKDLGGVRGHVTIHNWMREDYPGTAAKMGVEEVEPPEDRKLPHKELELYVWGLRGLETATNTVRLLKNEEYRGKLVQDMLKLLVVAAGKLTSEDRLGEVIETLELTLGRLKAKPYRPHDSSAF